MTESGKSFLLTSWLWSRRTLFTTLALLGTLLFSNAQVLQTSRFEFPLGALEHDFQIIPAGTSGVYLTRHFARAGADLIQIIKLDTAFKEQWAGFVPIEDSYAVISRKTQGDELFLLAKYSEYSKHDLILYIVNETTGIYKIHRIKSFIPVTPNEFQVTRNAVLIGGYFNRVPVVLHYDLTSTKSKVLPGLFNESGELNQIRVYDDDSFDVLISARNQLRQHTVWLKSYDPDGNLLINYPLEPEGNTHLLFGRSVKTEQKSQMIAGVFGTRNKEFSRGLYIANIAPSGLQQTRYYHFGDLKNFFKYMKAKREIRVKNRIERKKIKGKRARFTYRFLVHELIFHNDQYILLGEAFYPKYKNIERTNSSGFFAGGASMGPYIRDGRVFDGYIYTHAVVMGFDKEGNLLWDNSFEINDIKSLTLEQFVKLSVQDDKIALVYMYQNQIRTKIIKDDQVLEGKSSDPIKTFRDSDIVSKQSRNRGHLDYWYGDYLIAHGTQEIMSKENPYAPRRVFYINKVTFEEK
jgi:hypothetical protein